MNGPLRGTFDRFPARARWDLLVLLLIVMSCLLVPYQVAFEHDVRLGGSLLIYLIDVLMLIDIALGFRAAYRAGGVEITDVRSTARHYRRGRFPIDLLANLPFDLLLLPVSGFTTNGVSIVLILRMLRLLRVARMVAIVRFWSRMTWVNAGYIRIAKLVLAVILVMHWLACAWFLVSYADGFPPESWVAQESIVEAAPPSQYIRSLYWVVVTATSVGYGDITPNRDVEYVLSMLVILVGASMWAFIIGNIASLLSSLDSAKSTFWNRVELVTQFLRNRQVPLEVNEDVRGYYEYLWSRYRGANEQELLKDLPAPLRLEILKHLARDLLKQVPLFRRCGPVLRNELLLALRPMIVTPGGYIVREGELANGIFFISRGTVEVVSQGGEKHHGNLEAGDYFGDLSLLLGEHRTASVRCLEYCDVLVLPKDEFERMKTGYEEFRQALKSLSSERSDKVSALVLDGAVL